MFLRILYIGDVPIQINQSGGSVVLWRHQQLFCSGNITAAPDSLGHRPRLGAAIDCWLRRLHLTRLALVFQPLLRQLDGYISTAQRTQICRDTDAILTVAHGLAWIEARTVAIICRKPLITIVHDWYPDASGCPRSALWVWDYCFRQLLQQSDLVFAVSEGMAAEIGPHPNLRVLPPIPDPNLQISPARTSSHRPWQLYYSGFCGGLYHPLLQQLINAVEQDERFQLHLSGSAQDSLIVPLHQQRICCSGFMEGAAWQQAFDTADALVLVLSFEARHYRHLATHFPSKLVEYANRGRPIVIWGPPWSSAVQWAQGQTSVLCVSDPSAERLLNSIDNWLPQQPLQGVPPRFSSCKIAQDFEIAIQEIVDRRGWVVPYSSF